MSRRTLVIMALWITCVAIAISGMRIAMAAPKDKVESPDTITQVLIVTEAEYNKAGVARTTAVSIIDKTKISQVLDVFPNALQPQRGSSVPGAWEAEYRVYVFMGKGSVAMLTVGANGTLWTAPGSEGDLRTNGDFLKLLKDLGK